MRVSGMNIPQHMIQSALEQFQDWVSEHLPEAEVEVDGAGQVVVYTGVYLDV